jgi:hypothetical protein
MKLSHKMLSDLNKLCDGAAKLYEEYYVNDNGYGYDDEIDYQSMYDIVLNSFDNGYLEERYIVFEFGKAGTIKLLRDLKYSAEAILYYPDRVLYHDEYRLTALGQTLLFTNLDEARNKKSQLIQEEIDVNSLYERYSVSEITIETVDNQRFITFITTFDKNDLKNDSYYLLNTFDGQRIEIYGKGQLISTIEQEYQREVANLSEVMIIEQKIEDAVDHFTSWIFVES